MFKVEITMVYPRKLQDEREKLREEVKAGKLPTNKQKDFEEKIQSLQDDLQACKEEKEQSKENK